MFYSESIEGAVVNRVSTPNKESERASVKIRYLANILSLRHHMYMYMYMYLELCEATLRRKTYIHTPPSQPWLQSCSSSFYLLLV